MSSDFQPRPTGENPSIASMQRPISELKAPGAFRTISEVANTLNVPQHVLRFWESKFQQIKPLKRGGGRRYYRPEDVELLTSIKDLLYNQGFTIRGVQKLLREGGKLQMVRPSESTQTQQVAPPLSLPLREVVRNSVLSSSARREIEGLLNELKALRELLRQNGI